MGRRKVVLLFAASGMLLAVGSWGAVKILTAKVNLTLWGHADVPWSLEELVSVADAIAKGRITGHQDVSGVIPFWGTPVAAGMVVPAPTVPMAASTAGMPQSTWFGIDESAEVVELLKDDGAIGRDYIVGIGGTVPKNGLEWAAREASVWPAGRVGETYLDFLDATIESSRDKYALAYGPSGRVRLDGTVVEYSDHTPVPFAAGMTPAEFYQAVTEEVARQHLLPQSP